MVAIYRNLAYNIGEPEGSQRVFRHPYPKCEALQQVFRHLYPKCGALTMRGDESPLVFLRGKRDMNVRFENLGLYNIDTDYLRYLNSIEPEVQFTEEKDYAQKPFLGVIVTIDTYSYFIPLTSGKPKHAKWKNVGAAHYLVYEQVKKTELRKKDIYKSISETDALKIYAALDLKKMIPVRRELYTRIDFSALSDEKYADLLEKEYRFCQKQQDGILSKVTQIYTQQKESGKVFPMYCNFAKLEEACDKYIPAK